MGLRTEPYTCKHHGITQFYERPDGRRYCRECHASRENAKFHKDNSALVRRYGITVDQYDKLLEQQNNSCAICQSIKVDKGRKRRLCVDHDHVTGKVRGLVCNRCNRAMGLADDSPELLVKMADYLYANREK